MSTNPDEISSALPNPLVTKLEHDAAGAAGGAAAGAAAGLIVGPGGALAGAIVGGLIGAVATALVERERDATEEISDADAVETARESGKNPAKRKPRAVGAFSAASMGVSSVGHAPAAEGPISPPED